MLSSSLRNASLRSARVGSSATRRVANAHVGQRFQSTNANASSSVLTHAAAGFAGGAVVILAAYGYYHFSGVKKAVDATTSVHAQYQQLKTTVADKAPKSPNEALKLLRGIVKSYAGSFPGASAQVDSAFDALDELHETHAEEFNNIVQRAYDDVTKIVKEAQASGAGALDVATATKVMGAAGRCVAELRELGKKVGNETFVKLEEKFPTVAQTLGSSYGELKSLAQRSGPEAKKFVEESVVQLQELLSRGGNSTESFAKAKDLVQGRVQRLKEMIWDSAAKEAKGNPELEKLLNENKEDFIKAGSSVQSLREVIERVGQTVKEGVSKEKLSDLRTFVQKKAQESQSKGLQSFQEWVKAVPGGDEALKKLSDVDVQSLMQLSQQKTGEAKQLAEETYRDILKVLQEKAGKAKNIAEEAKSESQK